MKVNKFLSEMSVQPIALAIFTAICIASESSAALTQVTASTSYAKAASKDFTSALRGKLPEKDGTYLYGRAPVPQQIGQEYMVFELHQGRVVGAFYLPYSEFSCFAGNINSNELALMVANAPDISTESDSVAQEPRQIAAAGNQPQIGEGYNPIAYSYSVALQEYYQLPQVTASDRQILQTCQDYYSR